MTTAIGYARVSTDEQADHGISLEAQEAKIRAYCAMRGLELVDLVIDAGVSAGKALDTREGGKRVLSAVKSRKVQAVVAIKLDRLFRDCADCLTVVGQWDKVGIALHLIDLGGQAVDTSSAMGRFFLTVMAGAAEMERNLVRERTSAAMAHKKAKGERVGSIPFGYELDEDGTHLVEVPGEQEIIAIARKLKETGLSLRAIASQLSERGYRSRTGRDFAASQIKRMLAA